MIKIHCLKGMQLEGKMKNWSRRHELKHNKINILFKIDHLTINDVEKYIF